MEIARRSGGMANAPVEGGDVRTEKSTISCQSGQGLITFIRNLGDHVVTFPTRDVRKALALGIGNDSGMAPQAIEIAQNGLGRPLARGSRGKEARTYTPPAVAQDETGCLARARRCVAFASHRRVEESTRGDKTLRTRA